MNYNGFSSRINNIIDDALNTMDFSNLSGNINSTVKDALYKDDIKLSKDDDPFASKADSTAGQESSFRMYNAGGGGIPVSSKPAGTYSGMIMIVCGIIGVSIFGVMALVTLILGTVTSLPMTVSTIVLLCLAGACAGVIAGGANIRKQLRQFKEYLAAMDNDEFCEIKNIAGKCRRTEKATAADLRKMINKRMFIEGHLDDTDQWFIGNNEMYQKYMDAKSNYSRRKEETDAEAARRAGETAEEANFRMVMEKGRESIRQIRDANTALPGEEISRQLDKLESLVGNIFKRIEEKPSLLPEIKKFMDYYLPTTVKLVNVYKNFEKESVQSDDIVNAKKEIEQTLAAIETAFEKLLSELYEDTVMDVSTDISVLKTMFARDGLTEKDFK